MENDYLSKPDGNVLGFLQDQRVWSAAAGAIAENLVEKQLFTSMRQNFGVARDVNGQRIFVDVANEKKTATLAMNNPSFQTNRHASRVATVIAAVAAIEYTKSQNRSFVVPFQYAMLGAATTALAHIFQDLFPALGMPQRN